MKIQPRLKTALVLLAALSILATSLTAFVCKLNSDLKSAENANIVKSAAQNANAITTKFNEKFTTLTSLANFMSEQGSLNDKTAVNAMHSVAKSGQFSMVAIADVHGDSIADTGVRNNITGYDFFQTSLSGRNTISDSPDLSVYSKKALVFSVPVYKNKSVIGVLRGITAIDHIKDISVLAPDGGSYALIKRDGSIVFNSNITNFQSTGKNIFAIMSDTNQTNKNEFDLMRKNIGLSASGMMEYEAEGSKNYLYYMPLSTSDWYLLTIVPTDVTLMKFRYMLSVSAPLALGTACAFALLGVYCIMLLRLKNNDIKKSSQELRALTVNIPGCVQHCKYDSGFTMVYCSDGFLQMTGYTRDEIRQLFDNKFINMIYEPDREEIKHSIDTQLQASEVIDIQYRLQKKDGSPVWILERGQLIIESSQEPEFYSVLIDITNQREIMQELEISNERYQIVMDQSDSIIFEFNILSGIVSIGRNNRQLLGDNPVIKDFLKNFSRIVYPDDADSFRLMFEKIRTGAPNAEGEYRLKSTKGAYLWCGVKITTIFDKDDRPVRAIGTISDITCQKEATQTLMQKAQRDGLTGLLNKAATETFIEEALKGGDICALYIIDVDYFKNINDNLGHMFGDAVLADIGCKLKKLFRTSDVVGRIGGDEFMVLLKSVEDMSLIFEKAGAINRCLSQTFGDGVDHYSISSSVGIAMYPKDGLTYADLYKKADVALYEAKRGGRNRYMIFGSNTECIALQSGSEYHNTLTPTLKNTVLSNKSFQQDILWCVFDLLYHAKDIGSVINMVLKMAGEYFHANHAYIFQNSQDDLYVSNTFEWSADNVESRRDKLQNICHSDLGNFVDLFNVDGIFFCSDISLLPNPIKSILNVKNVGSILQVAILGNGKFKGYVGFEECGNNRMWTREEIDTLSSISKIIGVFVLKKCDTP